MPVLSPRVRISFCICWNTVAVRCVLGIPADLGAARRIHMSEAAQPTRANEQASPKPETFTARAYAAQSPNSGLAPFTIARRDPQPEDVQIQILYCGVCHSDLHQVR